MTLTRPWGAVAEAGKTQVRTPHLRPRRGGGSRASGGRLSVCGHYPRGSRQRRDRCLIGASALLGICTKRLEGTSAAPTGNPGWRLRHTGCVLRAEAALCLTNEPARLSSGRWLAAPKGDAKGGNALWRAFASFWRVPKGWRRAGAQPRWPGARPKPGQLRYNTQNTVSVATRLQANPPRDALGGNAEVSAWQCARHCARSYKAKCKPAGHAPGGNAEAGARRCANALPEAARQSANPSGGAWRRCRGKHLLRRGARWP